MTEKKEYKINRFIHSREVFVLDENNQKIGVMSLQNALLMAENAGLDLVEISPMANPPVCRITDYGKFRYAQEKKLKEAKKNQVVVKLREIRMQPKIDSHDLDVKTKSIAEFLTDGDKCKVTIRFRGRELAHTDLGKELLDKILVLLNERNIEYNVDSIPSMEGRNMSMLLSPSKKKNPPLREKN